MPETNSSQNQIHEFFEIPQYHAHLSPKMAKQVLKTCVPVQGVDGLFQDGKNQGLETTEALLFLQKLYRNLKLNPAYVTIINTFNLFILLIRTYNRPSAILIM